MSVTMMGDKKPEQPAEMPSDPVPEGHIVAAFANGRAVYAEAISITGPVVRFLGAYIKSVNGERWFKSRNLMCFYTPVRWCDAKPPVWWPRRDDLPEEP